MQNLSKKEKIIKLYETVTVPRKLTLSELAKKVGCSRSYCEQVLNIYRAQREGKQNG
jgi:MarR-like DNA-binding transcriptional regulator SgrR of sgrS sRNA